MARNKPILGLTLFVSLILLISLVFGSSVMWSQIYGDGREMAKSIVESDDGGYVIAGDTGSFGAGNNDFWLIKVDSNGIMEWNKTFGGPRYDSLRAMIKTHDGGYALVGSTTSFGGGSEDFWLIKTDENGITEWNQTYGGPGDQYATSLIETSDGGYAIGGSFDQSLDDPFGDTAFWLVKTNQFGEMQWNKTFSDSSLNSCSDLVETSDGGYLLVGNTGMYLVEANILAIKTDSDGEIEWTKRYGGRDHAGANSIVKTLDGAYAIAGDRSQNFWLIKIDDSGDIVWDQIYVKSGVEEAYSLVQTSDGGFALAGVISGVIDNENYIDSWMIKTDINGNLVWNQTYGGIGDQYIYSLIETSDETFVLAGFSTFTYAGPGYLWLLKTDEYGYIPEFPSWIIIPLFIICTIALFYSKKKLIKN
ncbi:MAG: hypothetical protein P8Y18_00360 [Candidatus Bathyarchaeota archaeon]